MHGSSFYNMRKLGGSFNLRGWTKKSFPLCNCYDLAAITQLACAILVDEFGNERVDSSWVFQCPNGFINIGPLFGWVAFGGEYLRCNDPFWKCTGAFYHILCWLTLRVRPKSLHIT